VGGGQSLAAALWAYPADYLMLVNNVGWIENFLLLELGDVLNPLGLNGVDESGLGGASTAIANAI
jgi:CO/xanthine dehydrogenase Mo-binding subunit